MSGRPPADPGSWLCPEPGCGNVNFPRRTHCNKCRKVKPKDALSVVSENAIGADAAEKSKGLFSAADWQCPKCGNVNWARRAECNLCNHKREGKEEKRTGLGGGFNERDGVEYIRREDSEDEFDEWGRRKKKKSQENTALREPISEQGLVEPVVADLEKPAQGYPEVSGDVEEEEEEEDDEDIDMSKYDLGAEEEDDEEIDMSKYDLGAEKEVEESSTGPPDMVTAREETPERQRPTRTLGRDSTSLLNQADSRSRSMSHTEQTRRQHGTKSLSRSPGQRYSRTRSRSPRKRDSDSRSKSPKRLHSRSRSRSPRSRHGQSRSRSPRSRHGQSRSRSPRSRHGQSRSKSPKSHHSRSRSRSPRRRHSRSRSRSPRRYSGSQSRRSGSRTSPHNSRRHSPRSRRSPRDWRGPERRAR